MVVIVDLTFPQNTKQRRELGVKQRNKVKMGGKHNFLVSFLSLYKLVNFIFTLKFHQLISNKGVCNCLLVGCCALGVNPCRMGSLFVALGKSGLE